jgi:predicted aspartyl protease
LKLTNKLLVEAKIRLCSPKNKQWLEWTSKLDTGADDNWISPSIASQLGAQIVTVPLKTYKTFMGEIVESTQVVEMVTWTTVGIESSFKTDFRLASPSSPFEVLLGRESVEKIYQHKDAFVLVKVAETQGEPQQRNHRGYTVLRNERLTELVQYIKSRKRLERPWKRKLRLKRGIWRWNVKRP